MDPQMQFSLGMISVVFLSVMMGVATKRPEKYGPGDSDVTQASAFLGCWFFAIFLWRQVVLPVVFPHDWENLWLLGLGVLITVIIAAGSTMTPKTLHLPSGSNQIHKT